MWDHKEKNQTHNVKYIPCFYFSYLGIDVQCILKEIF